MANGYFERGEVYWVRMDNGFGGEQGVGRPGLIISGDGENSQNDTVTIVFLTTKFWPSKRRAQIEATGTTSYVIHNQIMTYDKSRLGKCIGMINSAEQKVVDDVLEEYLDLDYVDDAALKEKEREIEARDAVIAEKDREIANLKAAVAAEAKKAENVELSYKVENAMWQKLYEKVLNQVVDMKYTNDLFLKNHLGREVEVAPVEPKVPEAVVDEPQVVEAEAVEPVVVPEGRSVTKVNVNTASAKEIVEKTGMSMTVAYGIVGKRKRDGAYKKLEDLLNPPRFTQSHMDRYRDKLEV